MRKIYILLSISFLFALPLAAQKYGPAIVTFNNGNIKKGLIKSFAPNDNSIKFKTTEKSKPEQLKAADIRSIQIPVENDELIIFENMKVQNYRKGIIVRKLLEGPVSLYHMRVYQGALGNMDHYMLKRPDEEKCTLIIAATIGAKKQLKNYFEDSPALVEKIKSYDFTHIPDMVAFYNQQSRKADK